MFAPSGEHVHVSADMFVSGVGVTLNVREDSCLMVGNGGEHSF